MISARLFAGTDLLLAAPVRGLSSEVGPLVAELEKFGPVAVGLGISAEELRGLVDYFVVADGEPVVPLTSTEFNEVRGLVRFGEVRVPNPSFVETLRWGQRRSVPVAALDPSEEGAADLFTEHIGYLELVRRTVRERRTGRDPPAPSTPDAYAIEWERRVGGGRGSRALARARDAHLAQETTALAAGRSRIAVIVDRERFDGVRELLGGRKDPA
ncbi:MAG: hypothetical protein ACLQD8_07145 [Thermoplasmata archaeon]